MELPREDTVGGLRCQSQYVKKIIKNMFGQKLAGCILYEHLVQTVLTRVRNSHVSAKISNKKEKMAFFVII